MSVANLAHTTGIPALDERLGGLFIGDNVVWYDDAGSIYVGRSEAEVRQRHGLADDYPLRQDEDVLDTWFSSALWPFSTLGWPEQTPELVKYFPTSVLVTGQDILFFWVVRMMMMQLAVVDQIPFKDVYLHGLVRDPARGDSAHLVNVIRHDRLLGQGVAGGRQALDEQLAGLVVGLGARVRDGHDGDIQSLEGFCRVNLGHGGGSALR